MAVHMPVEPDAAPRGPLAGIRVVDCSSVVSGPLCTQILGDLGADVVKLEPLGGETGRRLGLPMLEGMSPLFANCNRNKRGVAVDLKQPRGAELARRLAIGADVFVENYRPGVADRLGLGFGQLAAGNPGLVYVSINGFGSEGPYRDMPAYDTVVQGLTGFLPVQGEAAPRLVQTIAADKTTSLTAAYATLAALFARERGGGGGQHVEVPMLDAYAAFLLPDLLGGRTYPDASAPELGSPYRVWPTKDGHVVMMIIEDSQFFGICRVLDREDLIDDPRCANLMTRIIHMEELFALLETALAERTTAEVIERARAEGAPVAPVNDLDAFLADPQVAASGTVFLHDAGPGIGRTRQVRHPARFADTPATLRRTAPKLGEHTDAVLGEAGFSAGEIAALRAEGVVA